MTKAVGSVAAGKELWFPNASIRETTGLTVGSYPPGKLGHYWASSNGSILEFYNGAATGTTGNRDKLRANAVRCVR